MHLPLFLNHSYNCRGPSLQMVQKLRANYPVIHSYEFIYNLGRVILHI